LFVEPLVHLHHTAVDERQERGAMVVFLHAACRDVGSVALPGCETWRLDLVTMHGTSHLEHAVERPSSCMPCMTLMAVQLLALKLDRQGLRYLCKKQRTPRFITQIELN